MNIIIEEALQTLVFIILPYVFGSAMQILVFIILPYVFGSAVQIFTAEHVAAHQQQNFLTSNALPSQPIPPAISAIVPRPRLRLRLSNWLMAPPVLLLRGIGFLNRHVLPRVIGGINRTWGFSLPLLRLTCRGIMLVSSIPGTSIPWNSVMLTPWFQWMNAIPILENPLLLPFIQYLLTGDRGLFYDLMVELVVSWRREVAARFVRYLLARLAVAGAGAAAVEVVVQNRELIAETAGQVRNTPWTSCLTWFKDFTTLTLTHVIPKRPMVIASEIKIGKLPEFKNCWIFLLTLLLLLEMIREELFSKKDENQKIIDRNTITIHDYDIIDIE